jgi:DNA-binding NarL/FixJ family response regulator
MRTRVLIVDEQPIVRLGLEAMLAVDSTLELVGQAGTGSQAMLLARQLRPDVVVIDLALPDMDGAAVVESLRRSGESKHFLVLTSRTGAHDINRALAAGAHGYLFKDIEIVELVSAIRTIAEGGRYIPPVVGRKAESAPNANALTRRERDVILWLARGHSYEMIGSVLGVGTETIKSHMKNILGKLGMKTRSEAVACCLREGLVLVNNL